MKFLESIWTKRKEEIISGKRLKDYSGFTKTNTETGKDSRHAVCTTKPLNTKFKEQL